MVVLTAGLGVGAIVVIQAKRIGDEKRAAETTQRLRGFRRGAHLEPASFDSGTPPRPSWEEARDTVAAFVTERQPIDAWGQPIIYRCPGPIHKNGWDLISCGANGVYEEGGGDDIVVGEDLPGGLAAISSESGSASQGR